MTTSKLPRKPSYELHDIADQLRELHDCVHAVGSDVKGIRVELGEVRERVAYVEGVQKGVAQRLGAPQEPGGAVKPLRAILRPWHAVVAVAGGAAGYKLIVAMAEAAHRTLMGLS